MRGLFNAPTVVNNVETLMNLPDIITKGGEWFAGVGMGKSGGTRIVCVSGHVVKPGVYELPMGISTRALIYDVCGGIPNGRALKGVIPGGSSMPPLDASELDVPIEFDALMTDARIKDVEVKPGVPFDLGGGRKLKTMAGSGGVVVFDDSTDVVALCARIMEFYAHESCGQCTPCREGSGWLARVCRRLARGRGRAGRHRAAGQRRQRHRRQHDLRAGRRGGVADAGVHHQVPRRLRGQARAVGEGPQSRGGPAARAATAGGRHEPRAATPPRPPRSGDQIIFCLLAAWVTVFAIFTITRRNPVTAVMSLVATFFGLAAIYASLSAHFLAVLQVLVYAGAIMVLFIFVVMILNREEVAPLALRPMRLLGVAAAVYLLAVFANVVAVGVPTTVLAAGRRPTRTARSRPSATCCSGSSCTRSRPSRCCCWSRSSGGVVVSRSHQKEVAATRAADYRKKVEELAEQRLPRGAPVTSRPPPEGITEPCPPPTT